MKFLGTTLLSMIIASSSATARIGETALQFVDRYGSPKDTPVTKASDKNMPLVEGAIHHIYEYQGWRIRAAFLELDGPCVRMEYRKLPGTGTTPAIQDYELQAIMTANTAGMTWSQIAYNNPDSHSSVPGKAFESFVMGAAGNKMWRRSDGVILWLRGPLMVQVELPIAREHEESLRASRDQKARKSVPSF